MTEDDRTIDADDHMLDELRRLAADACAEPDLQRGSDETIDADESTMDLLRQFAAEARADSTPIPSDPDETPPGGFDAPPTGKHDPPFAAADTLVALDPDAVPKWDEPAAAQAPEPLPQLETAPASAPLSGSSADRHRSSLPPLDGLIEPRPNVSAPLAPSAAGSSWRPPPRMVMPTEPQRVHRQDSHRWRAVSLALAAVLVVVLVFVGYNVLIGDDAPAEQVPGVLPVDGEPVGTGAPDGGGNDGG